MVVPLLIRGLRSKLTATRRQSAVIIDNMSKLVDDPLDAEPFLATLMPTLQTAAGRLDFVYVYIYIESISEYRRHVGS
jgi:elongation factor 3